ncbi:hypothetical protein ACET3Z_027104 [Daucus carota]
MAYGRDRIEGVKDMGVRVLSCIIGLGRRGFGRVAWEMTRTGQDTGCQIKSCSVRSVQESQTLDGPEVWKSIETWKMYSYSVTRKEENDATACDL